MPRCVLGWPPPSRSRDLLHPGHKPIREGVTPGPPPTLGTSHPGWGRALRCGTAASGLPRGSAMWWPLPPSSLQRRRKSPRAQPSSLARHGHPRVLCGVAGLGTSCGRHGERSHRGHSRVAGARQGGAEAPPDPRCLVPSAGHRNRQRCLGWGASLSGVTCGDGQQEAGEPAPTLGVHATSQAVPRWRGEDVPVARGGGKEQRVPRVVSVQLAATWAASAPLPPKYLCSQQG